jgi:hypothetical protein
MRTLWTPRGQSGMRRDVDASAAAAAVAAAGALLEAQRGRHRAAPVRAGAPAAPAAPVAAARRAAAAPLPPAVRCACMVSRPCHAPVGAPMGGLEGRRSRKRTPAGG